MPGYLAQLRTLSGLDVTAEQLESVEVARALRDAAVTNPLHPTLEADLRFDELLSARFKAYVEAMASADPGPVHVWTPETIDCGILQLPSLLAVNFAFQPDLNESGVLVLSTTDGQNSMLLDWQASDAGGYALRLEVSGADWTQATF